MIKSSSILLQELSKYANPASRIRTMVRNGQLIPIIRGLYETDHSVPGHYLSSFLYGPSYLSFEFALSWHDLIPEAVYTFTSATCGKGRKKLYNTAFGTFTYRDVPAAVFPYGTIRHEENGYVFFIASPEKAVCDLLYTISPCSNRKELRQLLFDDFRLDEDSFSDLNRNSLMELAGLYHTANHRLLISLIREMNRHDKTNLKNPKPELEQTRSLLEQQIVHALIDTRINKNLTQKELSEKTGIPESDICDIENGICSPTISTLETLADGIGKKLIASIE